jgi:hypothetical protein
MRRSLVMSLPCYASPPDFHVSLEPVAVADSHSRAANRKNVNFLAGMWDDYMLCKRECTIAVHSFST